MIEFYACSNYRGCLQIKKTDNGKYYWRVDCDLYTEHDGGLDEQTPWLEIPEYLWVALEKYYKGEYVSAGCEKVE